MYLCCYHDVRTRPVYGIAVSERLRDARINDVIQTFFRIVDGGVVRVRVTIYFKEKKTLNVCI